MNEVRAALPGTAERRPDRFVEGRGTPPAAEV